jgi:thioester reductase-like protein
MNAMHWADRNLKTLGGFTAFVFGDRVWHSKLVHDQTSRIASGLAAMGVSPGDRVLLWLPNCPELALCWRAVLRCGGVTVVAHHDAPLQRVEQLVAETEPTAIVTSAERFGSSCSGATLRHRIHIDPGEERSGWIGLGRIASEQRPLVGPIRRSDHDVACIEYTSGTTGTPKGVLIRHGTLAARLRSLRKRYARWRSPVRHLSVLPMSSGFGSLPLIEGLARKCTHHFLDRFDPEQVLQAIERYRIQRISLVPAMCEAILAVPDVTRFDVSSLRTVICGGAKVPADLIDRFRDVLGIRIANQYGMTGVGGVSRTSPDSKPGSVGRPFGHLQAKVVDREGRELPAGETGELMLNLGDGGAVEYWNADGSTTAIAQRSGWYRTGDLSRFDPDGELYVVGRKDDLIIQGGHNVHAATVAEIVERLPEVRECAAVGVPNALLGQEIVACVALRDGARLTAGEIITHCRKHLEPPAVPASVRFVDALPRNDAGKVKSHELRHAIETAHGATQETELARRLRAAPASARHELLREEVMRILEVVLSESGTAPAAADASFIESGLDSLGAVELTHVLSEAIGRPVPATLTFSHPTVDAACGFLLELMGWGDAGPSIRADRPASPAVDAEALRLDLFLSQSELDAARRQVSKDKRRHDAKVVLLTGANGFLGRFLALEILERLPAEGILYCLVRSSSGSPALERFHSAYQSDRSLGDLVDRQLRDGRLVVLAGDLAQRNLGLQDDTHERLRSEVDRIVHNGAVVDHVLGYRELFAPNVLGTIEIIRLALAGRSKSINYVSTVAARGPSRNPANRADLELAAGYSVSKWASERLLRELHNRARVSVRIHRPSHIMAHSTARGQINAEDTLTRLLQGIVLTSLAPRSFYAEERSTNGAHYDGLPVDAVARAIAASSLAGEADRPKYSEHNVVNPHRDVSLDVITDWVRSAGYPVERVDDYTVWYQAFTSRLSSLGRPRRSQSLLPLIHAWEQPIGSTAVRYGTKGFRRSLFPIARVAETERPIDTPRITEEFIHKCLKDMHILGLIEAAG